MKILVTGGSGKLGRAVVRHLVEEGHDVLNVDAAPSPDAPASPRYRFLRADLTDHGQVLEVMTGVDEHHRGKDSSGAVDAVVHLAAIPAPGMTTDSAVFANNTLSTYSVFAAARTAGITNVVWASSETVLGLPFTTPPPYAPVDEEYAPRPETSYSLSKDLGEEMARQLCRWEPAMKIIGLRFSNVMEPHDYAAFPGWQDDARARSWNLWGYIDARDGAQAVLRALQLDATGADVFIIANADTVMERPSAELLAEVFPDVPLSREVTGTETLLSIDKARRVLGFEPQHGWRG